MTLADLLLDIPPFAGLPEAVEHTIATDARATRIQQQRSVTREDALRIAVFTRGTSGWASITVGLTAPRVILAPWMRALPMKAGAL